MLQNPQEGAELLSLAEAAEKHLREHGYDVKIATNEEMTAFEVIRPEGTEEPGMIVRVQSLRDESWEMVRPNGETITGVGGRDTFLTMMERLVDPSTGRPQRPQRPGRGRRF